MIECAGRRLGIPFADYWRPTAANYWGRAKKAHGLAIGLAILGPRWERDHTGDKKPALAEALENAFDPAANTNCIGLDQAARDSAAAWLPPGMAYGDTDPADLSRLSEEADPELNGGARVDGDLDDGEAGAIHGASIDLPSFLTDDKPADAALNGASAP